MAARAATGSVVDATAAIPAASTLPIAATTLAAVPTVAAASPSLPAAAPLSSALEEEQYALDRIFDIVETEPVAGRSHGVMTLRVKLSRAASLSAAAGDLARIRGVVVTQETTSHTCAVQCAKEAFPDVVTHVNQRKPTFLADVSAASASGSASVSSAGSATDSGAAGSGEVDPEHYQINRLFDIMETEAVPGTSHGIMTFRVKLAHAAALGATAHYLERVPGVVVIRHAASRSCALQCWKEAFPNVVKHVNQRKWAFVMGKPAAVAARVPAEPALAASATSATAGAASAVGAADAGSAGSQALSTTSSPAKERDEPEEEQYALERIFDVLETVPASGAAHGIMTFRVKLADSATLEAAAGFLERVRGVRATREEAAHSCAVQCWKDVFPYVVKNVNRRKHDFVAGTSAAVAARVAAEPAPAPSPTTEAGAAGSGSAGSHASSTSSLRAEQRGEQEEEQYVLKRIFDVLETEPIHGSMHGIMTFRVKVLYAAELDAATRYLERVPGVLLTKDEATRYCTVQCWKEAFPYVVKHVNQRRATFVAA